MLKSETHEGILGFFHCLTLDPSGFKALAKSANSVSKMYPKYICFLLCPLTPPWSNHHHCSRGSAAASQTGSFFLPFLSPFRFPHKSSVRNWTTRNWLRSFRWLYIRCKIKSKLPKRCRIYLSNLQSSHPPSSSSCSQQRCQVPLITGSLHTSCHSRSFWRASLCSLKRSFLVPQPQGGLSQPSSQERPPFFCLRPFPSKHL